MSEDKPCLKSCYELGFHSLNRLESDLLNEVLYILVGQEAAKISEVKVGGQKKICQSSRTAGASVSNLAESAIPYQPPTLTSDIFSAS